MRHSHCIFATLAICVAVASHEARAVDVDSLYASAMQPLDFDIPLLPTQLPDTLPVPDTSLSGKIEPFSSRGRIPSIYELPYSMTGHAKNWGRLWANTGLLTGAFVGTLLVLECLPEDATSWNRAALQEVPLFERWNEHVIKKGPEWDHDKFYFNWLLHPYAGAVYYMSARSCGFNAWQSLLYCSIISNIGWEYGIEAFMERPSYQDLFVTPLIGSAIGEGFYHVKRHLVANDYRLLGSSALGEIVGFLVDPVNGFLDLFRGNPARRIARERAAAASATSTALLPMITPEFRGFTFVATF